MPDRLNSSELLSNKKRRRHTRIGKNRRGILGSIQSNLIWQKVRKEFLTQSKTDNKYVHIINLVIQTSVIQQKLNFNKIDKASINYNILLLRSKFKKIGH